MSTRVVQDILQHPGGDPIVNRPVTIQLNVPAFITGGTVEVMQRISLVTDATGLWSVALTPNAEIDPAGTYYTARATSGAIWSFIVPAGSGAVTMRSCLVADPTNSNPIIAGATVAYVDAETARAEAAEALLLAAPTTHAWTSGPLGVGVNTVDATAGAKTPTLPTPTVVGQLLAVEKTDTTTNTVTISGTIRGASSSLTLRLASEAVVFEAESLSSWRPLADHKTLSSLDARYSSPLVATAIKTATYTAAANDLVPADATSAGFTVTLPTAPADKTRITVKKIDSTTNVVTIAAGGSDVFNKAGGSTTLTLKLTNQLVALQYASAGAIWYVVGDDLPLGGLDSRYDAGSATIIYVDPSGSDSNAGLLPSKPVATLGQAITLLNASGGGIAELLPNAHTVETTKIIIDVGKIAVRGTRSSVQWPGGVPAAQDCCIQWISTSTLADRCASDGVNYTSGGTASPLAGQLMKIGDGTNVMNEVTWRNGLVTGFTNAIQFQSNVYRLGFHSFHVFWGNVSVVNSATNMGEAMLWSDSTFVQQVQFGNNVHFTAGEWTFQSCRFDACAVISDSVNTIVWATDTHFENAPSNVGLYTMGQAINGGTFHIDGGRVVINNPGSNWTTSPFNSDSTNTQVGSGLFVHNRTVFTGGAWYTASALVGGTGPSTADLSGTARAAYAGAWATSTLYPANAIVTFVGSTWLCTTRHTSSSTFDPTKFLRLGDTNFGFPYTVDPGIVRSSDLLGLTLAGANSAVYMRVLEAGVISKIALRVGTSSGNISVGCYSGSGVGRASVPGARYATSGAVACPAAGYAEISLGGSVTVLPGDYLAISADNTTATFQSLLTNPVSSNIGLGRQFFQLTAHPLPSSAASLTACIGNNIVLIGVA